MLKLLALAPGHRMRREQLTAVCWPEADDVAAGRSLRVALHAARQFLGSGSGHLVGDGDAVILCHVRVDVAELVSGARAALRAGDRGAMTEAVSRLAVELLPEDRYADWLAPHVRELAALRQELRGALASPATSGRRPKAWLRHGDTPLRGRQRVLETLAAPRWTMTVISGEAGVGKTRLVAEAARLAADAGATVLWGTAYDAEGPTPYGMIAGAIDDYAATLPSDERMALLVRHPALGRLLSTAGNSEPSAGPEAERALLFRAVAALLAEADQAAGVRVVLDDLHAADMGSFQLLYHLARTAGPGLKVWATLREEEVPAADPRRRPLTALLAQQLAGRVELMRLSESDCRLVVADANEEIDGETLRVCCELSGGNPLFARELAAAPDQAAGLLHGTGGVPERIGYLAERRFQSLSPQARGVVELLAVAGEPVRTAELAALADGLGMSEVALLDHMDEAVRSRIIGESPALHGGPSTVEYVFRHPLIRLACRAGLTSARRRRLHTVLADVLVRYRPEAVDVVAYHLSRADDPRAVEFLRRAARRAASMYANDAADGYYSDLVARLDQAGLPAATERFAWGAVLRRQGQYDRAVEVLGRARAAHREAGETNDAVRTAAALAEVLGRAGRPAQGLDVLAGHDAESVDADAAALFHLARSVLLFGTGRYTQTLEAARRAEPLSGDEPLLRARSLVNQAAPLVMLDRLAEARMAAEAALTHAERAGDAAVQVAVVNILGNLAARDGRHEDARTYGERTLELAEFTGDPAGIAFARSGLAREHLNLGDIDAAAGLAGQAVALARRLGESPWCLPYTLVNHARVLMRQGRVADAERDLSEALRLAEVTGDRQVRENATQLLADVRPLPLGGTPR
ncbi:tetratricopeptide repeat protein [Streptomyces sp. GbtcB7]|uniref:ATP-binding protein n=1 Tax=Streptomyces sp. GbtcB7 TaxID=2824752 RepID=UPI001C30D345|nr:tetratricopeptide repeat protein [Streptomyces sp. GbtcB7]